MNYLHLVVFLSTVLPGIHGFASWMTSDFCRRELRLGEVIMNEEVVFSDLRLVEVYRDGVALRSNQDKFVLGETLTVKISDSRNQYVYEVSGNKEASFVDGGCDGRRIADKKEVKLQLPEKNDQDSVTIVVAWAAGPEAVKLSPTFVLLPPGAVDSSEKDKDTDSQTAVLPSSDLSQNHTIDIKEALVSASNLRGREEPLQHIKSTEKKVDDRIQEVITAFSKKKEIQQIGSSGEDRKEEKEEVVYNPNKKRRFKNMRERVLFKAAVYIALGAIGFFALAFVIRYRHNLYRLVRKWLGGKVHDEE